MNQLLRGRQFKKFLVAGDRMHKEVLWTMCKSWSQFWVLVQTPQVTRNVRGNVKMPLYKFTFTSKFRLTWNWYVWRIKSFRKIAPQESLVLGILKFIFWNNLSTIYFFVVTVYKIFLTALLAVALAERSFSKLKITKLSVVFHLPRVADITFNYINWKLSC